MPEILHDLPFDEYLKIHAASAHGLMLIERSPAHYRASIEAPREPSPAQALGTLTHLAVLEWDRYQALVRVAPDVDRRTKAGKASAAVFEAECAEIGAIVATAEQDAKARSMREAVISQPFARALLADGRAEVTMLWTDMATGVACKARADWVCSGHEVLVDIKTAADASERAFAKACGQWSYHIQAAHYVDAALACGLAERAFVFIAVEPEPPHAVGLYQLDEEALRVGRMRRDRALETYHECITSGIWPGYAQEIRTIEIPKWAL